MTLKGIKLFAFGAAIVPMIAIAAVRTDRTAISAAAIADDTAATYKTKCAMCHGPTAAKAFDPAKTDEEHIQVILKGKKGEKPPYMPGYEEKGITAETAKALVEHMRQLKSAK